MASSVGSAAGSVFWAWLADPMAGSGKEGWMVATDAQSAHCLGAGWLADALVPRGSDQEVPQ